VITGQVTGSRAGDEVALRRRVVVLARVTAVSAAVVLAAGFAVVDWPSRGAPPASVAPAAASRTQGAGVGAAVRPTPFGTSTTPVIWHVTRTADPVKNTVVAAYQGYLGTSTRLAEEPDPADPALPLVAMDPELGRLRRSLSVSSDGQLSRRGRVLAYATLVRLTGREALVIGCQDSARQVLYQGPDRQRKYRGGIAVQAATLRLQGGRWLVMRLAPLPPARCHG
jgi:hypothetical protein